MAAPTNVSATTAITVGTVPVSYTQDVHDAGTTYTVWVSFTPSVSNMYGLWSFGALGGYRPLVRIYNGPASAPVLVNASAANQPMQEWLTSGTTYWLEIVRNSAVVSPANLVLSILEAPADTATAGNIFVPDDTDGFPAAILSQTTDYTAIRFVHPFPNGENADILENGLIAMWDAHESEIVAYNRDFTELTRTALTGVPDFGLRANRTLNRVYLIKVAAPNSTLYYLDSDGLLSATTETITAITDMNGIAVSNDGTILYWATNNINASSVRRWNLSTNTADTDLAASIGSNYFCTDLLILEDDSILVLYNKSAASSAVLVKRYQDDGTLLNTYDCGENTTTPARLAYALDSPDSFWVWTHLTLSTPGVEQFANIRCSDGTVIDTVLHMEYELGDYQGTETATPLARFGSSYSCPFLILTAAEQPTRTDPIRRQRTFLLPSSPSNKRMTMPYLELLMETGHGLIDGQGSDPQVMLSISKDGGQTWLPEQWRSGGRQGAYRQRVRWMRTPNSYRNAVCKVVVSDPIDWKLLAMETDNVSEGSS